MSSDDLLCHCYNCVSFLNMGRCPKPHKNFYEADKYLSACSNFGIAKEMGSLRGGNFGV